MEYGVEETSHQLDIEDSKNRYPEKRSWRGINTPLKIIRDPFAVLQKNERMYARPRLQ